MIEPKNVTCTYSREAMADAIVDARGSISDAAERLGCSTHTLTNRLNKDPMLKQVLIEARQGLAERLVTLAVRRVEKALLSEDGPEPVKYVTHTLDNLGGDYGYRRVEAAPEVKISFTREFDKQIVEVLDESKSMLDDKSPVAVDHSGDMSSQCK